MKLGQGVSLRYEGHSCGAGVVRKINCEICPDMSGSAVLENRSAQLQSAEFRQVLSANHTHVDYLGVYMHCDSALHRA